MENCWYEIVRLTYLIKDIEGRLEALKEKANFMAFDKVPVIAELIDGEFKFSNQGEALQKEVDELLGDTPMKTEEYLRYLRGIRAEHARIALEGESQNPYSYSTGDENDRQTYGQNSQERLAREPRR